MKKILIALTLTFISSSYAFAYDDDLDDYYPSNDSAYRYMLMQEMSRSSNHDAYPGCDTCYLGIMQGDSYTARMLRNDMWRMETGHSYSGYLRNGH